MNKVEFDLCDEKVTQEVWANLESTIGFLLPVTMKNHYKEFNGGQPIPSFVHDKKCLFPVNAFDSVGDMLENFKWNSVDSIPKGFKTKELLIFAYDPGSGSFAVSLRECDFGKIYFYVLELEAIIYAQWNSFDEFIHSFVEDKNE
ncbi:SMI1/KNR4 family protein [Shewanella woodyi]|uniref:SMI1/KNR4 family protein n=1 Tax=Shewanella woodyi TaxID=60961 RepID=UPI003748E11B